MTIAKQYQQYFDLKTGKLYSTVRRAMSWCVTNMEYAKDTLMHHEFMLGNYYCELFMNTVDQLSPKQPGKPSTAPWEDIIQQWTVKDIEQAIALHRKYCYDPVREFAEGRSVNR